MLSYWSLCSSSWRLYNIQPPVGIELLLQLKIQIQNTEIQNQIQGAGQAQGGWPGTPERRSDRGRSAELPTDLHKVLHSNTQIQKIKQIQTVTNISKEMDKVLY